MADFGNPFWRLWGSLLEPLGRPWGRPQPWAPLGSPLGAHGCLLDTLWTLLGRPGDHLDPLGFLLGAFGCLLGAFGPASGAFWQFLTTVGTSGLSEMLFKALEPCLGAPSPRKSRISRNIRSMPLERSQSLLNVTILWLFPQSSVCFALISPCMPWICA